MKLRKYRGNCGRINIYKLSDFELNQLISVLESLPSSLLNKSDTKPIILDTDLYRSDNGFKDDFVEVNLVQLCHPCLIYVIGASL